ncbi:MAG TPA: 50S ribosomal protein L19 [Candidatus Omnitrophota bacterium]|nr:50S ribosomal protein L19 [Candidatus Omnitrophota bacterium]HPW64521.1 50S ribosomal protein L19 [Candidatus Omnitrophota bacterium]
MMGKIKLIEKELESKKIPEFRVGDTLKVHIKVKEGDKSRLQLFEGICIRKKGRGANASFSVVKESYGDMVEKLFPLYSPSIEKITVASKGKARRAKLYHFKKKK